MRPYRAIGAAIVFQHDTARICDPPFAGA